MKTTSALTLASTLLIALGLILTGCNLWGEDDGRDEDDNLNVVEVTARGLDLEGPDEVPSGWTTFRLKNVSDMVHFAVLERLPEGIGIEDQQEDVAPVFQEGMDLLNEGEVDSALAAFGALPAWFGDVVFMSGPGLISGGKTAQSTVYLEPGTYVLECYVKTNGVFHSYNPSPDEYGMIMEITVTEDASGAPAPEADIEMTISSENGIAVEGNVEPGEQTVAVHFADQTVHEHFLGHDVHLARLEEDTDMDDLAAWMNWSRPGGGLDTPAPVEFLGGTHEMPAGETGYFTANLEPGRRYAWIAEVPNPTAKDMLKTFTVPSE